MYLLGASINDCRFCHTNERPNGGRQQLSALLPPSSSEPVSDSFKAAARNAFPQLYSLPSHIAPWVWLHYLTRPRNLSQLCQVASSPRRFVASLKLCLGLRIAAGRTSGRAWDFSWQFVESELPGKKESMECSTVGEREIPCSRTIYFRSRREQGNRSMMTSVTSVIYGESEESVVAFLAHYLEIA